MTFQINTATDVPKIFENSDADSNNVNNAEDAVDAFATKVLSDSCNDLSDSCNYGDTCFFDPDNNDISSEDERKYGKLNFNQKKWYGHKRIPSELASGKTVYSNTREVAENKFKRSPSRDHIWVPTSVPFPPLNPQYSNSDIGDNNMILTIDNFKTVNQIWSSDTDSIAVNKIGITVDSTVTQVLKNSCVINNDSEMKKFETVKTDSLNPVKSKPGFWKNLTHRICNFVIKIFNKIASFLGIIKPKSKIDEEEKQRLLSGSKNTNPQQ